jgi:hypothetical protein
MHTSNHDDDDDDGALLDRVGLVRGLLVIVTAIAVGAFLVAQGPDGSDTGSEVAVVHGPRRPRHHRGRRRCHGPAGR